MTWVLSFRGLNGRAYTRMIPPFSKAARSRFQHSGKSILMCMLFLLFDCLDFEPAITAQHALVFQHHMLAEPREFAMPGFRSACIFSHDRHPASSVGTSDRPDASGQRRQARF